MSNPRNIKWPQDTSGFLYRLKHTGVQAVERINGHEQKYEDFMATLSTLARHAKERYEQQRQTRAALIKQIGVTENTDDATPNS